MKYELIKEYPGSLKLGDSVVGDSNGIYRGYGRVFSKKLVEDQPEYWEPILEITENVGWKILAFRGCTSLNTSALCTLRDNGLYAAMGDGFLSLEQMLSNTPESWVIKSVSRLSDGVTFTAGDTVSRHVNWEQLGTCHIESFKVVNGVMSVVIAGERGISTYPFDNKMYIYNKTIAISEDGVPLRRGDRAYIISRKTFEQEISGLFSIPMYSQFRDKNLYAIFSSKEARDEYRIPRVPALSIMDMHSFRSSFTAKDLEDIVRKRMGWIS